MTGDATTVEVEDVDWQQVDADDLLTELKKEDCFDEFEDELRANAKDHAIRNTYEEKIGEKTVLSDDPPLSSKLPTAIQFLINCFVSTKTVVTNATVDNVDIHRNTITLTVRGPDTRPMNDRNDDKTYTETFEFDLDDEDDQKRLEALLNKTTASSPENLRGKRIPVYTKARKTYQYKLYGPLESPSERANATVSQLSRKLRLISVKTNSGNPDYTVFPTKNFLLVPTLIAGLLVATVGQSAATVAPLAIFGILYALASTWTILHGIGDAYIHKAGERDWIHQLIE